MLTEEVQHNHNQNNRVQQVQNRCCNADDCRNTEVGYDVAECNSQDNYLCIGNLVVCQLCEIGCAGGGQTDCCGQAGKEYDDCQNQYAVAADQRLCDCNNQTCLVIAFKAACGCGCTQECQTAIDNKQCNCCENAGFDNNAHGVLCFCVAFIPCCGNDDDNKYDRSQNVHGLIACHNAFSDCFKFCNIADIANGVNNTQNNHCHQTDYQNRCQVFADYVNNAGGANGKQQNQTEEDCAENPAVDFGENRHNAHFKCCCCGTGDCQEGPDTQND